MSKVDDLRALREARYAAQSKGRKSPAAPTAATAGGRPAASPLARPAAPAPAPASGSAAAEAEVCGHRNMSGRTCTRPAQHAEKNHRYS